MTTFLSMRYEVSTTTSEGSTQIVARSRTVFVRASRRENDVLGWVATPGGLWETAEAKEASEIRNMPAADTRNSLARWRTGRRVVLGAIVLAGSVVTSAAVMYRMAARDCTTQHEVGRAYTYSGVGVVIERDDDQVVVRRVLPGAPAEDKLFAGARLVSVDGDRPETLEGWATAIRGAPGTTVDVEVAYPCGGHKVVSVTRDVIRVEY